MVACGDLKVIDHEQPMSPFSVRFGRCRLRPLEQVTQGHEFVRLGDLFCAGRRLGRDLPVARYLQVDVGFLRDVAELPPSGANRAPFQMGRDRIWENRLVGVPMRAGDWRGRIHVWGRLESAGR